MKTTKKTLLKSFVYAFKGISITIRSQGNARIHIVLAFLAMVAGLLFQISMTEWCIISILIGMVLAAETINTAIEKMVDLVTPQQNDLAGQVKDISAGAVLITSIIAAIGGILIFVPKILS